MEFLLVCQIEFFVLALSHAQLNQTACQALAHGFYTEKMFSQKPKALKKP